MFGYIKTCKPEMKVREYETYRGVYCSLCRELGRRFGLLARFTLNYDYTFLALLKMAVSDEASHFEKKRCAFNPTVKCNMCTHGGSELDFAANTAMIMLYYKIKDNLHDYPLHKKLPMALCYPFVSLAHKKVGARFPEVEAAVSEYIREQAVIESSDNIFLDAAAQPTANVLAFIFSTNCENETQRRILHRLGYCIGRWIYFMDAVDDLEEDLKNKSFNPFLASDENKELTIEERLGAIRAYAEGVLNLTAGEAAKAFELLTTYKFREILNNIIYLGMEQSQNRVLRKEAMKHE